MSPTYWYLFPIALVIAAVANGAGIGGATFFSPLFILALGLEPEVAIGTALITEVFGFASGVVAHARARTVDWKVVRLLMVVSIPTAVVGSLIATEVPPVVLKLALGVGLLAIAVAFIRHRSSALEDSRISSGIGVVPPSTSRTLTTRNGELIEYELCRRNEGRWSAGVGGLSVGLISTGLGELNSYALIMRCRIPSRVTVATSVVVVAVTALAAGTTHALEFIQSGAPLAPIIAVVAFTVPGVLIGAQLGPWITSRIPELKLIHFLGWLFVVVAVLTLTEAAVG
jgi:uncharacterized membrane protein YfcA